MELQHKNNQKEIHEEPLLWLPKVSIAIFTNKIVHYPDKIKAEPPTSASLPTLPDLEQT